MHSAQAKFQAPTREAFQNNVDFSILRYGQCWEDADILLEALGTEPGRVLLSITSAGDNAMSLLTTQPKRVLAVDLSPAQCASLELRVAAFRTLGHQKILELLGSRHSRRREDLYLICRPALSLAARRFWDSHPNEIRAGAANAGRFEKYMSIFRRFVLPLCHGPGQRAKLLDLCGRSTENWFKTWDNVRWRLFFRTFASRSLLGRFGRDPAFHNFANKSYSTALALRFERVATSQMCSTNPYLHSMVMGRHGDNLPSYLRHENFEVIRNNLDCLELHQKSLEQFLGEQASGSIDAFNLSNIFEYMPLRHYHNLLAEIARVGRKGARLAYWNLFAERRRPLELANFLDSCDDLARTLHQHDQVFFYSDFVVEEVV